MIYEKIISQLPTITVNYAIVEHQNVNLFYYAWLVKSGVRKRNADRYRHLCIKTHNQVVDWPINIQDKNNVFI